MRDVVMYQAFLGIYLTIQFINMSWFWMRRKHHPIPKRKPPLVMAECVLRTAVGVFLLVFVGFPEQFSMNCAAAMLTYIILFFCSLAMNLIRPFLVFWWHIQTIMKIKFESKLAECGSLCRMDLASDDKFLCWNAHNIQKWIWRHRKWLNTKFWIGTALFILLFVTSVTVGIVFALRTNDDERKPVSQLEANSELCQGFYMGVAYLLTSIAILWWIVPSSLIAYRLRNIKENFKLKEDMNMLAFKFVIVALLGFIWIDPASTKSILVDPGFYYIFDGFVFRVIETIIRDFRLIYWSYEYEREAKLGQTTQTFKTSEPKEIFVQFKSEIEFREDMMNTMKNNEGLIIFEEFLRAEFAMENLFFVQAFQSFTRLFDRETLTVQEKKKLRRVAVAIRDKFILDSSPLTVNLSYPVRKEIVDTLAKYPVVNAQELPAIELASPNMTGSSNPEMGLQIDKVLTANTVDFKEEDIEGSHLEEISIDSHIYDHAYEEILKLMATDSYRRFVRTTEFKAWRARNRQAQTAPLSIQTVPVQR
jgi:heme/copper-type cytochrome/quinol oxidase subunit 2